MDLTEQAIQNQIALDNYERMYLIKEKEEQVESTEIYLKQLLTELETLKKQI